MSSLVQRHYDQHSRATDVAQSFASKYPEMFSYFMVWNDHPEYEKSVYALETVDGTVVCIALVHHIYNDPGPDILIGEKTRHTRPIMIDYIFTLEKFRQRGYARRLVLHLALECKYGISAITDNDISAKLFKRCRFRHFQMMDIFRFP